MQRSMTPVKYATRVSRSETVSGIGGQRYRMTREPLTTTVVSKTALPTPVTVAKRSTAMTATEAEQKTMRAR